MKIYCAGPITGLDLKEAALMYEGRAARIRECLPKATVWHPFLGMGVEHAEEGHIAKPCGYEGDPLYEDRSIWGRDKWMVQNCDLLVADLTLAEEKVSIGTSMEMAWAADNSKTMVIAIGIPSDPKDHSHAMNHCFVRQAADLILPNEGALLDFLRSYE